MDPDKVRMMLDRCASVLRERSREEKWRGFFLRESADLFAFDFETMTIDKCDRWRCVLQDHIRYWGPDPAICDALRFFDFCFELLSMLLKFDAVMQFVKEEQQKYWLQAAE